jgi:hypothetical protein
MVENSEVKLKLARKLLKKQKRPAFIYEANCGVGTDERGYYVAYVSALNFVREDTNNDFQIVEYNQL